MRLDHFITHDVEAIEAHATIQEALNQMRARNIGFMPVHLEGGLVGVVTDSDIEIRVMAQRLDPKESSIAEIMTANLITCSEDESAEEAINLMNSHQIRRLIVVNDEQHVVGIVTLSDLALPMALNSLANGPSLPLLSFPVPQFQQQKDYVQ